MTDVQTNRSRESEGSTSRRRGAGQSRHPRSRQRPAPDKRREVFLGVWSSYELVAHLIGWDYANIQAIDDILAGQLPHFYAHRDPDWRAYNAHLVSEYSKEDWDELMAAIAESHQRLLAVVRALPAEELYKDRGIRFRGYKVMIGRLLEADVKDCTTHAVQVLTFKDRIK